MNWKHYQCFLLSGEHLNIVAKHVGILFHFKLNWFLKMNILNSISNFEWTCFNCVDQCLVVSQQNGPLHNVSTYQMSHWLLTIRSILLTKREIETVNVQRTLSIFTIVTWSQSVCIDGWINSLTIMFSKPEIGTHSNKHWIENNRKTKFNLKYFSRFNQYFIAWKLFYFIVLYFMKVLDTHFVHRPGQSLDYRYPWLHFHQWQQIKWKVSHCLPNEKRKSNVKKRKMERERASSWITCSRSKSETTKTIDATCQWCTRLAWISNNNVISCTHLVL